MIHNPLNPVWIDYAIQIVPIGQRTAANARAETNGNYFASDNDGIAWDNARELSAAAAPVPPVTHLLIGELIRQPQKDAFVDFGSEIPGGVVYLESDGWTIETALADAGLDFIPDDEE